MKVEIDLPPAKEGFEYTGEFRQVQPGEFFLDDSDSHVRQWHLPYKSNGYNLILRRLEMPPKPLAPEGYEHTGECRVPTGDDVWADPLSSSSISFSFKNCAGPGGSYGNRRWILRKKWTPPAEFPEGWWLYSSLSGTWWLNPLAPHDNSVAMTAVRIADWLPDFVPPPTQPIQVRHGKN